MKTPTQATLRHFTEADWQAYAGAESENPRIADWEDGTVLIWDGTSLQLFTHDDEGEMTGFWSMAKGNTIAAQTQAEMIVHDINQHGDPAQTAGRAGMIEVVRR